MSPVAHQQLNAIHAMLAAGHRNLRVERHSLMLWGLTGGALFILSEMILTPDQFPDLQTRATLWLAFLATVLGGVGYVDWRWTRGVKAARDEAWSFIHRQVQKVWWLLLGLATLITFAMFFFGGGYMLCATWLGILGLGLYLHGLFSEELLEWIGAVILVLAVGSLAIHLPYETIRILAASVFGLGLPLLALVLDRGQHRPLRYRLAQVAAWLALVLAPPALGHGFYLQQSPPEAPIVTLADFRAAPASSSPVIVQLPAGTVVPVEVDLAGDLFTGPEGRHSTLPLVLEAPLEVLVQDGKLSGDARRPGGPWLRDRNVRWIHIPWIKAELNPSTGPVVRSQLIVQLRLPNAP